ncbi:hypothetical protein FSARC_3444 [Fusarium sarcochroum]|uniref:Uncharacterized protein n=1 Tax=Fusarium sarcochroum TaxID=1208366 RepID=A0A8H4XCM5_9HYPO|nr:hypothetical protein FSARC_3444 [Fusarium sarcochroum]
MSNQPSALDPQAVNHFDDGSRQAFMARFFTKLKVFDEVKMKASRLMAIEATCKALNKRHWTKVSPVFFEYEVDTCLWENYLREHNLLADNPWPWLDFPDPRDLSEGTSPIFESWLRNETAATSAQPSDQTHQVSEVYDEFDTSEW